MACLPCFSSSLSLSFFFCPCVYSPFMLFAFPFVLSAPAVFCLSSCLPYLFLCLCGLCCFLFPFGLYAKRKGAIPCVLYSCVVGVFYDLYKIQTKSYIYFLLPSFCFPVCLELYALRIYIYASFAPIERPQKLRFFLHPFVSIHYQVPVFVDFSVLDISAFCNSCHVAYLLWFLLSFSLSVTLLLLVLRNYCRRFQFLKSCRKSKLRKIEMCCKI